MARSLIMPRLTTSRPRSGSLIAERTVRTWSLLGTEDDRGPQGQHSDKDEDGNNHCVDSDPGGRARPADLRAHVTARLDERGGDADHRESPERQPHELAVERARGPDRDEEQDEQ